MKTITIKQPFVSLIAKGYKTYEFRTWKTKYRGEILIHAGKGVDKKAMERFQYLNLSYPSGCIIAKAKITDCIYIDDKMFSLLNAKDPFVYYGIVSKEDSKKYYGFQLEDIIEVEPVK